ncbi:MAG: hypothetical protein CSA20_08570 [Deltaproteobacteria bacterium]|nr:MAG: hypothetical protein CSA20_08570 [Deltaproteobacteria bacterium]
MNKRFAVIIVMAVIGFGVWYYFISQESAQETSYACYLPSDTLMTMSAMNVDTMVDEFPESPLGHLLSKETMGAILAELDARQEIIAQYNQNYDSFMETVKNPAFQAVFGDDTSIAVLTPDAERFAKEPERELKRILVAFATTNMAGALESFAKMFLKDQVSSEKVAGYTLTRIRIEEGENIYGYTHEGTVMFSFDPKTIIQCLTLGQLDTDLARTNSFKKAKAYWQGFAQELQYGKNFFNIKALQDLIAGIDQDNTRLAAEYLNGISCAASITYKKGDTVRIDSRIDYVYDRLHPNLQTVIARQPSANATLHLLDGKTLLYDWAGTLIPELILPQKGGVGAKELAEMEEMVQQKTGISIETLVQTVGPQYGFIINEIVNTGLVPIPKVLFFVETHDREALAKNIDALREQINLSGLAAEQVTEDGEQTIYSWSILPGEATELAMMLTEDMLYICNGKSTLTSILSSETKRDALQKTVADALGNDAEKQLVSSRTGSVVIYPARLAEELQSVTEWLINTLAATKGVAAGRLGQEILALMRSYEVVTITSTMTREHGAGACIIKKAALELDAD